jgi:hypothetical protein
VVIKNYKNFVSGLLFTIGGIGFAIGATRYSIGTAVEMYPGYFPFMLGILLAIIGAAIAIKALCGNVQNEGHIGKWALKPLFFVVLSVLLFGILLGGVQSIGLPPMGLVIANFALAFVASKGGPEFTFKEAFVVSAILTAGSYFVFVKMLNLPFQIWPEFITG